MTRPSEFNQATADLFCELLADGAKLAEICGREDMPAASTIFRWMAEHPEFERQYELARRARAHRIEDEILEIVDDKSGDRSPEGNAHGAHGGYVAIQRDKLRVETRWRMLKRYASKNRRPRHDPTEAESENGPLWDGPIEVEFAE